MSAYHAALSIVDLTTERNCPCPKEQCGMVDYSKVDPTCDAHGEGSFPARWHTALHCSRVPERKS